MPNNTKNAVSNKGLGRGLEALISEIQEEIPKKKDAKESQSTTIPDNLLPLDLIEPGVYQPRKYFDQQALQELADSIKRSGLIQPIIVSPMKKNGKHYIIAGERRWRASKIAGLSSIPALIRDISDQQAYEIALVENVQRKDLNVIEEAEGYKKLIENFNYTQEKLADIVGKSRSHITNLLRLLALPDEVKQLLAEDAISMGHARALLMAKNPLEACETVIKKGLSVRQTEALIKRLNKPEEEDKQPKASKNIATTTPLQVEKDDDLLQLEQALSQELGLEVSIQQNEQGGKVEIKYFTLQDLDTILQRLSTGTSF